MGTVLPLMEAPFMPTVIQTTIVAKPLHALLPLDLQMTVTQTVIPKHGQVLVITVASVPSMEPLL